MFVFILALAVVAVGAIEPSPGLSGADPPLESFLPPDDLVPGWQRQGEPSFYEPDNLYEYINGAASGYLAYDFQQLVALPYRFREEKIPQLVVNIYRMSTPLNGFGIYSSERSPDLPFQQLGTEGYVTPQLCAFWQGPYYVKIQSRKAAEENMAVLEKFAEAVASRLPGPRAEPGLLSVFPAEGKVARSEMYLREDLLGHAFLRNGFLVNYRFGEKESQAFLCTLATTEEAQQAYAQLRDFFAEYGEVYGPVEGLGEQAFLGREPFYGRTLIAQAQNVVGGLAGIPSDEVGQKFIEELLDNVFAARKPLAQVECDACERSGGAVETQPNATGGQCLGSGWGQRAEDWVRTSFPLETEQEVALFLRYACVAEPSAAASSKRALRVELDGRVVLEKAELPDTGGEPRFQFIRLPLGRVPAGEHQLTLAPADPGPTIRLDLFYLARPGFEPEGELRETPGN